MRSCMTMLGAVVLFGAAAFAADTTDYSTWIYQTQSDTNSNPSSTSSYSFGGGSFWSSKAKPAAGKKYYVPVGILQYTPNKGNGPFSFLGDVVAVAGEVRLKTGANKSVTYPELRLLDGGLLQQDSAGTLKGVLAIASGLSNPSRFAINFKYDKSEANFAFASEWTGDADGVVRLTVTDSAAKNHTASFSGGMSNFCGMVILDDPYAAYTFSDLANSSCTIAYARDPRSLTIPAGFAGSLAATEGYVLNVAMRTDAANFKAFGGGELQVTEDRTVGSLSLDSTSKLVISFADGAAKNLTVTEKLSLADGATISLDGWTIEDISGEKQEIPVLTLAAGAVLDGDLAKVRTEPLLGWLPRDAYFKSVPGENGTTIVVLAWDTPVVRLVKQPPNSDASAFLADGSYWSDEKGVHGGADYVMSGYNAFTWSGTATFPCCSLTIGMNFYHTMGNISCSNLVYAGTRSHNVYGKPSSKSINGRVTNLGTVTYKFYASPELTYYADVVGDGTFQFTGYGTSQGYAYGTVEFKKPNTNFTGRIWFDTTAALLAKNEYMRAYVSDGRQFGGAWKDPGIGYEAVTIEGYSLVTCRNSVSFDEPTRGFKLVRGARFNVPADATLSFGCPITYDGEFRKEGAGVLALGGTAVLGASNRVSVVAGALKPLAKAATDGLDIVFSAGTSLIIPAGGDGLSLVAEGSDVRTEDGTGTIDVRCEAPADRPKAFEAKIATVDSNRTDLATFAERFALGKVRGYLPTGLEMRDNGDGTTSLVASFERSGFLLLFR